MTPDNTTNERSHVVLVKGFNTQAPSSSLSHKLSDRTHGLKKGCCKLILKHVPVVTQYECIVTHCCGTKIVHVGTRKSFCFRNNYPEVRLWQLRPVLGKETLSAASYLTATLNNTQSAQQRTFNQSTSGNRSWKGNVTPNRNEDC